MQEPVEEDQEMDDDDLKARMTDLCQIEDWPLEDFKDGETGKRVKPPHACIFLMLINIKKGGSPLAWLDVVCC